MKHLYYAGHVLAVDDQVASAIQEGAAAFSNVGRNTTWPVACYRDEHEEVVQMLIGPGIPILISDPWLADDRPAPKHSTDSADYITAETNALDVEDESPLNVVIYGRYDKRSRGAGTWTFSSVPDSAADVAAARAVIESPAPQAVGAVENSRDAQARGIGVSAKMLELNDQATYGYCSSGGGCTVRGTTSLNLWQDLYWYGDPDYGVGVAGSVYVTSGPNIQLTTNTCKTFYEIVPFDQVLHEWSNCSSAQAPFYTNSRQINWAGWNQGSAVNTKYHLEYTVKFKVAGDVSGNEFKGLYNSNSYKITSRSSADFIL